MVEIDPLMENWLLNVRESTARQYKYAFDRFKKTFTITTQEFLELAKTDKIKVKNMLNKYYKQLRKQEYSHNYCATQEAAVKSFLNYYEIAIRTKARKTPRKHHRKALRKEHIRAMVDAAPLLRDKALIIMAFQSGMAISDLIALNYGNVRRAIEDNKDVYLISYIRGKSETEARAIIGHDSILYLKKYISWRQKFNGILSDSSPLFIRIRLNSPYKSRLSTRSAQDMIRKTIVKAGLTTFEELDTYTKFNPWGFHAIRKAFSSIAKQYMPSDQVEMSMGHTLDYNGAYIEFTISEMLENYKKAEPELSIFYEEHEIIKLREEVEHEKNNTQRAMRRLVEFLQERLGIDELSEVAKEILQP